MIRKTGYTIAGDQWFDVEFIIEPNIVEHQASLGDDPIRLPGGFVVHNPTLMIIGGTAFIVDGEE